MLMVNRIKLTEKMTTFVKNNTSLLQALIRHRSGGSTGLGILDDCDPARMPVQAVQGRIRSASANTSSKVLPLASVYRLSVDVVCLSTYETDVLMWKVDRRKIVEKVDPVELV